MFCTLHWVCIAHFLDPSNQQLIGRSANQTDYSTGVVRTAVFTTAIQVASRFVLVWAVQHPFPSTCQSPIYSSMLFAWSLTEVIRYSYLALKLSGWEPYAFFWVRYSSYRVLYPVGILSEMGMMWLGFNEARGQSDTQEGMLFQIFLGVCLFLIWPWGAYTMIGHMNKQRRKVMAVDKSQ
ncbi:protein-tyrosine phosphatase-like protein, partial [Pseudomassariella vexata]